MHAGPSERHRRLLLIPPPTPPARQTVVPSAAPKVKRPSARLRTTSAAHFRLAVSPFAPFLFYFPGNGANQQETCLAF